jgi:CRISPR-associated protein Csb2
LIEVPSGCKLSVDDLQWAFSGVAPVAADSLDVGFLLTIATNESSIGMLAHYGIGEPEGHRRWRTVTPMALSNSVARRRIDPERKAVDRKGGQEREVEGARVAGAVVQALRHAGVTRRGEAIRVQREPFESGGERAEEFAEGTRFSKHSLWHVEIEFSANLSGPLLVGDGRFLGLGLMAPLPETVPYP